jgi:hypothetical protein
VDPWHFGKDPDSDPGAGFCHFRQWPSKWQLKIIFLLITLLLFEGTFTSSFKDKKSQRSHKTVGTGRKESRFLLDDRRSGAGAAAGSAVCTKGSRSVTRIHGSRSGRPKTIPATVLVILIRHTGMFDPKVTVYLLQVSSRGQGKWVTFNQARSYI